MIEFWWEIPLLFLIGIAEFILSWLNHRINNFTFRKKHWKAAKYDIFANTLSEIIPLVIYVYTQRWIYVVPRIIANTCGTWYAAKRKKAPAPKTPRRRPGADTVKTGQKGGGKNETTVQAGDLPGNRCGPGGKDSAEVHPGPSNP